MSSHRPLQKRHVRGTSLGFLLEWFLSITHTKPVFYHNIQYTLRRRKTFPGELGLGLCPLVEGSLHPTPPWAEMELCVPAGHGGLKQASKVGGCPDATPPGRNAASVPGVGGPPGGQGPKWSTQRMALGRVTALSCVIFVCSFPQSWRKCLPCSLHKETALGTELGPKCSPLDSKSSALCALPPWPGTSLPS